MPRWMKRQESLNKTRESTDGAKLSWESNHSAPGLIHMALKLNFAKEKKNRFCNMFTKPQGYASRALFVWQRKWGAQNHGDVCGFACKTAVFSRRANTLRASRRLAKFGSESSAPNFFRISIDSFSIFFESKDSNYRKG